MTPPVESLDEITRRLPGEWVLLESCRFAENGVITHGCVVFSSADREAAYRELHHRPNSVVIFTGSLSPDEDRPFLDPVVGCTT